MTGQRPRDGLVQVANERHAERVQCLGAVQRHNVDATCGVHVQPGRDTDTGLHFESAAAVAAASAVAAGRRPGGRDHWVVVLRLRVLARDTAHMSARRPARRAAPVLVTVTSFAWACAAEAAVRGTQARGGVRSAPRCAASWRSIMPNTLKCAREGRGAGPRGRLSLQ